MTLELALHHYFLLLTLPAIITAVVSGAALGYVIHKLRPGGDIRLTGYLAVVLGFLWYIPQVVQLMLDQTDDDGFPWQTLGKLTLYLVFFVLPMWAVLKWRTR